MSKNLYFKISPRGFSNEVIYLRVPEADKAAVEAKFAGFEDRPEGGYCGWTDDERAHMLGVAVDWADRRYVLPADFW